MKYVVALLFWLFIGTACCGALPGATIDDLVPHPFSEQLHYAGPDGETKTVIWMNDSLRALEADYPRLLAEYEECQKKNNRLPNPRGGFYLCIGPPKEHYLRYHFEMEGLEVELGLRSDGVVVWREAK